MDISHETDRLLRDSLSRAISRSSKSRSKICEGLSKVIGRTISINTLNNWSSPSKQGRKLPADCVPALCEILKDDAMLRQLLTKQLKATLAIGESVTVAKRALERATEQVREFERRSRPLRKQRATPNPHDGDAHHEG